MPADAGGGGAPANKQAFTGTVSPEAQAGASAVLQGLVQFVMAHLHPHHREHEPGGKDRIYLLVSALKNMTETTPAVGHAVIISSVGADGVPQYVNGPVSAAVTKHGAYCYVPLPCSTGAVSPPGPLNISGSAHTISAVNFRSDGTIACTATGGSYDSSTNGADYQITGLSTNWADDAALAVTITSGGTDGTYLVIDWAVA